MSVFNTFWRHVRLDNMSARFGGPKSIPCSSEPFHSTRFITVINFPTNYWLVDVNALPAFDPAKPRTRAIRVGPLVDMVALQTLLNSGTFDLDNLWIATDKCEHDLGKESWKVSDVLQMLAGLNRQQGYRKSEWCQVLGGGMVPCDVYVTRYDAERQQCHPRGLEVYLKFSINDGGQLTIVMVSCHA